jgi:uncharacterized membrane protein
LSQRYILEREFLRSEYDRSLPVRLRVVGALLGYAFGVKPADRRLEDLIRRLEDIRRR